MRKRCDAAYGLLICMALLYAPVGNAQSTTKKKVTSQADLPRFSYPVSGSASDLLQADDATFNAFAAKVQTDLDSIFREYDIADKATLRTLLGAKLDLQELAGYYPSALKTIDALRDPGGKACRQANHRPIRPCAHPGGHRHPKHQRHGLRTSLQ